MLGYDCRGESVDSAIQLLTRYYESFFSFSFSFRLCSLQIREIDSTSVARSDLVDVVEQIRGIRVDTKRACACEFFLAVASG